MRIRQIRERRGLMQKDLAKALRISSGYLSQMELGERNIDALLLYKIAKEKHFSPVNENEVACWLINNREAITKRSIEIQWGLLDRLRKNPEAIHALSTILSAQVWIKANRDQVNQEIQKVIGGDHVG